MLTLAIADTLTGRRARQLPEIGTGARPAHNSAEQGIPLQDIEVEGRAARTRETQREHAPGCYERSAGTNADAAGPLNSVQNLPASGSLSPPTRKYGPKGNSMSSGITVDERCISAFWELKGRREINAVIYRLSDTLDTVIVECQSNLTHDELLEALPSYKARLVVYYLPFATADGTRKSEIVLVSWLPEAAAPRDKTAYARASTVLLDALDGVHIHVQATTLSELDYHRLVSRVADQP
ncbi:actin-binding ADF family protein [Streptomyces sp. NPDC093093]|uniref:actin-binding ADF family protein n=1 Tax=Streptomyces sp. NPDC093093 TaxID=3366025 RepID=UPI00382E1264